MSKELVLEHRWRVVQVKGSPHLLYYGVRNPPRHHEVLIAISEELAECLERTNGSLVVESDNRELPKELETLSRQGILVSPEMRRTQKTTETMQVCKKCVTNDYVVPGLEFNEQGICALCQCYAIAKTPKRSAFATVSENELLEAAANNTSSRFDAMVLYTGGKDSSYMLWLLARKLKLRVLAAFWNMPYCSSSAIENIKRAKSQLKEVEFVEWTLPLDSVRGAMREKWHTHGWPCLCPTAAFPVLYPLASSLRIPYVFLGLEDVQAAVLDYVVPPSSTLSSPPPTPREQTLAFLSARALPREQTIPLSWPDEMANYHAAVRQSMPSVFDELTCLVKRAREDFTMHLPLIGRIATNEEYGTWDSASQVIEQEMGWKAPEAQHSLLHTSCSLEPVKDYLQFQRFKAMRTVFMPQSIVELGAAVFFGLVSRDEALQAVPELGYWRPPDILGCLVSDLGITRDEIEASDDELRPGLSEWAGLV